MKRLTVLLLTVLMMLSLSACGEKASEEKPFEAAQVQALVDGGAFSEDLELLDGDIPFALYVLADYGLTLKDLEEAAAVRSAGATCEEGAVLVFTDAEKAQTAMGAMEDYLENQVEENRNYRPAEIPKLENAILSQRGNSVALVVAADLEIAKKVLEIQ